MNPTIRPANGRCVFQVGADAAARPVFCPQAATMSLAGKSLCDQHAALAMTAACGRNVTIKRQV